jgi:hypothetical protein
MHIAAGWGKLNILRLLIAHGGDPYTKDNVHRDIFFYTRHGGDADIQWFLILEYGFNSNEYNKTVVYRGGARRCGNTFLYGIKN